MVYFDDWDTFKKAAEELYMASPLKVYIKIYFILKKKNNKNKITNIRIKNNNNKSHKKIEIINNFIII